MRIEVLIGSEEPIIFPIKSSKITIGTADTCDIKLDASGISRKHLIVSVEGDQYFVSDQGSTNGSFINEERLVPGRKVEFTSFFPVRLGDNVLVSLLSDEEGFENFDIPVPKQEKSSPAITLPPKKVSDSTTVINLKDLQNQTKAQNLVLERNQKREQRKKTSSSKVPKALPPKKKINFSALIALGIFAAGAYYNFFVLNNADDDIKPEEVGSVIIKPAEEPSKIAEVSKLVPENELPTSETIGRLLTDIKCTTDVEKYFCDMFPGLLSAEFGAVQVGLTAYILIDGSSFIEEARKYVRPPKDPSPELVEKFNKDLSKTALYIFLLRRIPQLNLTLLNDMKVVVSFFTPSDSGQAFRGAAVFYPKALNEERSKLSEEQLRMVMSVGISALDFTDKFYTTIY